MHSLFASLSPQKRRLVLLVIIYIGFISLGLPDTVLGVAWDSMRKDLHQPVYCAGFIATLLTACSAVSAFFSGAVLRRFGTGKLLMLCGFITGCSLLGYAVSPAFWCILLFAIPLGFGQGAVDTGMNFYVAKHYTSRDMSWLHCCWGIGATLGPILITAILSTGFSWRWGYAVVAAVQVALAILFLLTLSLWNDHSLNDDSGKVEKIQGKVQYDLRFWCCPAMFFLYCGIEASLGLWGFPFLTDCRSFSMETAGYAVAGYWGMLTAGRFILGFIANRLGNLRQIRYSMISGILAGCLLLIPGIPLLGIFALGLAGFSLASFYPAMMHAAPERFDDATAATVIGYQGGAGMLGIGVLPVAFGYLAANTTFAILPYLAIAACTLLLLLQLKVDGLKNRYR